MPVTTYPNAVPHELIDAPCVVHLAPVGTTFPTLDEAPASPWALLGTNGELNYTEDGVEVEMAAEHAMFRAFGDTGSRKAFRTSEDLKVRLTLADLTLEQVNAALNANTVTDTPAGAGTVGYRSVGLSRGTSVSQYAVLVRFPSPYMSDGLAQLEIPIAMQTGSPTIAFKKGEPAGVALEFSALVDPDASSAAERFGRFLAQDDVAGT